MRRSTRLTNVFSKKLASLEHAIALHEMHDNFVRRHPTLRMTPAMAAGVTNRLWSIEDIVALIDRMAATMNLPRFHLRTLMLVVAGAGLLFGLCRGMVGLFGSAGALALVLVLLLWVSTMFLIAVTPVLFCELIVYVIERVLKRQKGS